MPPRASMGGEAKVWPRLSKRMDNFPRGIDSHKKRGATATVVLPVRDFDPKFFSKLQLNFDLLPGSTIANTSTLRLYTLIRQPALLANLANFRLGGLRNDH